MQFGGQFGGRLRGTIIGLVAALAGTGAAQAETPLFAADTPINLTIKGPVRAVSGGGGDTPRPATLTYAGETLPITLAPRGITRRRKDTCQFSPMRVVFSGAPAANSLFAGQKRLKLVTHCRPAESFQQYLLLEYAAYRLYNMLTPYSFRVRLATIDYVGEDDKPITRRYGFFIEDVDDVAARNRTTRARTGDRIPSNVLTQADAGRFAIFSYAIANLDWSMSAGPQGEGCCHNARLLSSGPSRYIPVPYDFDFSGFVDAPYALPPDRISVPNVRTRLYRGQCTLNAGARAAAADLVAKRDAMLASIAATPGISERSRDRASAFLSASLDILATPDKVLKACL